MSDILPAAILQAFPIGCVILDSSALIVQANEIAATRVRRTVRGMAGESFFGLFGLRESKAAFDAALLDASSPVLDLDLADVVVRIRGFSHDGKSLAIAVFVPAQSDLRMRRVEGAWDAALEIVREVRHEINNPLMGILGQLELLQARTDLTPPVAKKLASIEHESGRIRTMAARLGAIKRV